MSHRTLTADGSAQEERSGSDGGGKRRRRRDKSTLSVARITTFADAKELAGEWRSLHETAGPRNPFASPDWLVPWAEHFVPERDLLLMAVRRNGTLIGLAPWYFRGGRRIPRRLQLLGSGRHDALTELPQVLAAPGEARSVLRAVVNDLSENSAEWDWFELPIQADQGWFEPEWLTGAVGAQGLVQHKTTRAEVVLDLPADVSSLHKGLKRNLLESTHRARNRLNRAEVPWSVTVHEGADGVREAVSALARLHAARAGIDGRRRHPDQLAVEARMDFLRDALPRMARSGQAQILTLDVNGEPIAAQLLLMAPETAYLSLSGVDPAWWQVGPVTLLQLRAAEMAIEQGRSTFSLSVGPSVAKLRWSEQVKQHPEFIVCGPRRSSRAEFAGFRAMAAVAAVHREAIRHRTTHTSKSTKEGVRHVRHAAH